MFNFLSDFLREAFYNFRRRGIVRIFFFDGGAVSIGVAIFAISNMGGDSSVFSSGFGIGVTSVGLLGLLSSYYESNFSFSRVLGYFFLEGGALQAGTLLYSLSNYGVPETRIPSLAHIGIGIGGVGVCCVLYIFRQMAVLYSDETIQLVRDLREFYRSESLAGSRMSRRRRSALRSIGLQLRVISWSLNRRYLKDSPSTAEADSSEIPEESDSSEDERDILMAIAKKTENGAERKSPSSSEESKARCEVKTQESVCNPLSKERQETCNENVATHLESQRTRDSIVKIPDSEKDSNETHSEGVKSEIAQGTTKSDYPPQGTSEYESKEEHGARKKTYVSKEVTKKTRAEKEPISEPLAVRYRVDRSSSNATLATDDLKSLEQVFGVSPPRKVSPEPLRKRRVSPVQIKLQKKKAEPPLEEKYGEGSDLEKRSKKISSDKSREQIDMLVEKCNEKEFEMYKYKPKDDEDITCFDRVKMKQEINSAVEELVAIMKSIMMRSPELNMDITQDYQEINSDAKVDEGNLDDSSDVSQNPEFADVSRKGAERVFEVPTEKYSSGSGRLFPTSIAENQLPEPSAELINLIVRGCSQNLSDARTRSVPGSNTMETLEEIKEIVSGISVPPLEYVDASEENKTLEEVEVSAHGVTRKNLMVDSGITEMDQPKNQSVIEEIIKRSLYSANPNLTFEVKEQDIHTTRSISEGSQKTEACSITSDNSKVKEGFPLDSKFQSDALTCNQDGYQSFDTHIEDSGDPQPMEVLHCDKSQPEMESVSRRGELEMVEPSMSRQGEPQFVKESVSHHDEPQSADKGVLNYEELQVVVENIPNSSEIRIVPIAESVMHSKECQVMDESALHSCEPHMVEESVLHSGEPQPVDESVSHRGKDQLVEKSFPHSDEPQPVDECILHSGEPQQAEESISFSGESHQAEKSISYSGEPQQAEESISYSGEPQPVDGSVSHTGKDKLVEKSFPHSDEPQQAEESISHSGEPQQVKESISYSDEPQQAEEECLSHSDESLEESVSLSGEPQPLEVREIGEYLNRLRRLGQESVFHHN